MKSLERKLICVCMSVYESEIIAAIDDPETVSVAAIGRLTAAGTGCGRCKPGIQAVIETHRHNPVLNGNDPPF
jgi:nitrite reductase (NADH) large subunit